MPFQVPSRRRTQGSARKTFEFRINSGLLYDLDRLRDGLESACGRNNFTVYGDIMQLTIRAHLYQPKNLVAQLQSEGALRYEATEQLPKATREDIMANGWYQIQRGDRD
jgi:hypothetical protein